MDVIAGNGLDWESCEWAGDDVDGKCWVRVGVIPEGVRIEFLRGEDEHLFGATFSKDVAEEICWQIIVQTRNAQGAMNMAVVMNGGDDNRVSKFWDSITTAIAKSRDAQ